MKSTGSKAAIGVGTSGLVRVGNDDLEVARIAHAPEGKTCGAPATLVFLHEGLGSVAMWRDFPAKLCAATRCGGLVYSRAGYGRSTPLRAPRDVDFMQREAVEVLPQLLHACAIDRPILFGHSDGASIALLYAAAFPDRPLATIAVAPHLFVEDISVQSIAAAREAYTKGELRTRLARYHDDVDGAFFGWNDVWLKPAFRTWNVEAELVRIRCPVLTIQGESDAYGTMAQIDAIARAAPQTRLLKLAECGHSPHIDRPDAVIGAVVALLDKLPDAAQR